LLTAQIVIIAVCGIVTWAIGTRRLRPDRRYGIPLLAVGAIYFAAMAIRLIAGITFLSDMAWFAAPIPAFFHLVLALFVVTWGHYHLHRNGRAFS
jgi:hypothetical protein